jgi:hypothetical protein
MENTVVARFAMLVVVACVGQSDLGNRRALEERLVVSGVKPQIGPI